ncbi:MAG TPA: hypothetical protein VGB37_10880 [Candidatus Lokiarchaeia archaeon]
MYDLIAMIFGIIGTVLLASKRNAKRKELIVFCLFLVSDTFLIVFSLLIQSLPLLLLYIIYLIISVKGIHKNVSKKIRCKKNKQLLEIWQSWRDLYDNFLQDIRDATQKIQKILDFEDILTKNIWILKQKEDIEG